MTQIKADIEDESTEVELTSSSDLLNRNPFHEKNITFQRVHLDSLLCRGSK